jgi:hypothetical protein
MAINFPTSPTTNDIHSENDLSWKFNGTSWIALPTPSVAGNVAYTPAGTGAVATDVETKLRESVSVKDFGAVGDGVADDTVAIQAALDHVDSLGGGSVYVPSTSSFYNLTETLYISSFTKLYGDGHGSSLNWTVAPTGTIGYVGGSSLGRKGITNKDYLDGSGNYQYGS